MSKVQQVLKALRSALGKADDAADADDIDTALAEVEAALGGDSFAADLELPDMPNAEVAKQLDELTALRKSMEEERATFATLRKQVEDEREQVAVAKAEADATAILGTVSGDVTLLATLLRKASPDERAALAASYRSAETIAKTAPVTRFGGLKVVKTDGDTLQSVAKSLQEKDPTLSDASALTKAAAANPHLYEAEVMASRAASAAMGV